MISDREIRDVVQIVTPSDLEDLYVVLGISRSSILFAERNVPSNDSKLKAMEVLRQWRKEAGLAATKEALLQTLSICENNDAIVRLEDKWYMYS